MKLIKVGSNYIVTFKSGCTFSTTNLRHALKVVFGQQLNAAR